MVSWSADGTMSGYDPTIQEYKDALYKFVKTTPGSVDLSAPTRLRWGVSNEGMPGGIPRPNGIAVTAPLTITAGDLAAHPAPGGVPRYFTLGVHVTPASAFASGVVPTPSQIRSHPSRIFFAPFGRVTVAGTTTFSGMIDATYFEPNTKYWVLLLPIVAFEFSRGMTGYQDFGVEGSPEDPNVLGKALSFWSNRSPKQPTIVSPPPGSYAPGDSFTLTLEPNDPDGKNLDGSPLTPDDALRRNADVAGIEFQYAAQATPENPDPVWLPLEFTNDWGDLEMRSYSFAEDYRVGGTFLWHQSLRTNYGGTVATGLDSHDHELDGQACTAGLPSGDWQIRGRTYDWAHPYPKRYRPWGNANPPNVDEEQTPFTFSFDPDAISPWSNAVKISVPAQVLPPVAISPKANIAIPFDGDDIPVVWKYLNTHIPQFDQATQQMQVRKVGEGEEDWKTITDAFSDQPTANIPLSQPGYPAGYTEHTEDSGFEGGGLDGWVATSVLSPPTTPPEVTNVENVLTSNSGSHHMRLYTPTPDGISVAARVFELDPRDTWITFEGFLAPHDDTDHVEVSLAWLDELGVPLPWDVAYDGIYAADKPTGSSWGGWQYAVMMDVDDSVLVSRNPAAKYAEITILAYGDGIVGTQDMRIDDTVFTSEYLGTDPFTLENSTHYEWRVRVTDTDGETSNWSTPARFWTVPAPQSGSTRPEPAFSIEGATLGCGTHTVEIYRRGGVERTGVLKNVSHVDWGRKRDDYSTAQIVVSDWDIDCGNLLASLQCWAYEVVIWRDNGFSKDRVWEGPITLLTYEVDKVTIDAKDMMGYAYRRIMKQPMNDSGSGNGKTVVARAAQIIQNAFAPDDPNVLEWMTVIKREDDAMQYRNTPAYSRTAYEEIDDMAANAGLDYTVLGRSIMVWGTKHRIGTLPEFRDEHLGNSPIVSEYGMSMANVYYVSNGNGVYGGATRGVDPVSGNDPTYGLVEMLSSTWASDSEEDTGTFTQEDVQKLQQSFAGMADRSIADRYPPPLVVRIPDNTSLNANTPVSIQHLVPGVVIPLRSTRTLRTVTGSQKLDSLKVVEESGNEVITITLSAFSRDDATSVDGEGDA